MKNAALAEAQAEIRIAQRNNNTLRYAGETTIMVESKEKLKTFLMKVKEKSEKNWLKTYIPVAKIMWSGPITS